MGEQTPSMGGFHQPPEKIESLLSLVRENLGRWTSPRLGVRRGPAGLPRAEGGCGVLRLARREGFPLDESYCKRVLDGRLPNVVPRRQERRFDEGAVGD